MKVLMTCILSSLFLSIVFAPPKQMQGNASEDTETG